MRTNAIAGIAPLVALVLLAGALHASAAAAAAGPAAEQERAEPSVTPEQFDRWMSELSNWGRWGPDDELGTLNLITDAKRIEAAALVRTGRTVSLSRDPVVGQAATFQRGFENVFAYGGPGLGERAAWIEEQHRIGYHGSPLTHLDALCHVAWDGLTYNGRQFVETATVEEGCTKNGVYPIRDGVVTRGILMDMPGAERVDAAAIEAWERETGITIAAGDALFLWTAGSGGFDNSIMPFLRERDIALLLADSGVVDGGPIEGRTTLPMHMFTLVALGMPLIDGADLEALAATAAELDHYEFLFVIAPLRVPNGAGSAINPLAVF
ncbi:MAG: cyclase family protein [Acidobacteria bacterium]|nr:cyclase family protein [Acidobacteriota bacterium]